MATWDWLRGTFTWPRGRRGLTAQHARDRLGSTSPPPWTVGLMFVHSNDLMPNLSAIALLPRGLVGVAVRDDIEQGCSLSRQPAPLCQFAGCPSGGLRVPSGRVTGRNLAYRPGPLLFALNVAEIIDFLSALRDRGPWDDLLNFIFDGGTLSDSDISALRLVDSELRAFGFCDEGPAKERLRPYVWRRASAALEALETGRTRYLQDEYA